MKFKVWSYDLWDWLYHQNINCNGDVESLSGEYKVVYSTGLQYHGSEDYIFEDDIVHVAGLGEVKVSINPLYGVEYLDNENNIVGNYADSAMEGDYPKFINHVI